MSTAFKQGLHRGRGWGGLLSPPPLFCKNKNKWNQKKLKKIMDGAKNSFPTQKLAAGSLLNFYFPLSCLCLFLRTENTEWTPTAWNLSHCPPPPTPKYNIYIYIYINKYYERKNIYIGLYIYRGIYSYGERKIYLLLTEFRVCTLGYGSSFVHFYLWPIMRCRP